MKSDDQQFQHYRQNKHGCFILMTVLQLWFIKDLLYTSTDRKQFLTCYNYFMNDVIRIMIINESLYTKCQCSMNKIDEPPIPGHEELFLKSLTEGKVK